MTFTVIALLLAQNVRTNRELVRQTAEAERLAESERKAAEEARSRAEQVFRLSAQKDLDDLIARADRLWPLRPEDAPRYREWLAEAERQLRALPEHENQLASLTRRGRALTSEERDLARAGIFPFAWVVNQSLSPLAVSDPVLVRRRADEAVHLRELAGHEHAFEEDDPLSGAFVAELLAGLVPLVVMAVVMGVAPMLFLRDTKETVNAIRAHVAGKVLQASK